MEGNARVTGIDEDADGLRILLVEDSAADEEMVLWALRQMPQRRRYVRVASAKALRDALETFRPHVILSDFSMPGFGGHEALDIVLERAPHVPFVFVSGTIGEESAIEALQRGAVDYVLKDNLRRLPTAIERALGGARDRAERARMQHALAESELRFRTIVETSGDWIWEADCSGRLTYTNSAVFEILGYTPRELLGQDVTWLLVEEDRREVEVKLPLAVAGRVGWQDWRLRWTHRDGRQRVLESTAAPVFDDDGQLIGFRGIAEDVTERLRHESKIRNLARIHAVLAAVGNAVMFLGSRQELLAHACRVAVEEGGFKAAGIGVGEPDGTLRVAATYGDPLVLRAVAPTEPMVVNEPGFHFQHPGVRAFRENRRNAVKDFAYSSEDPVLCRDMLDNGVRSQISLPIGKEPWGLLALYSHTVLAYDEEEVVLLQRLVDEIDYAVDFLAKSERLEYLAYHHPTTGLPNSVFLHEQVQSLHPQSALLVAAIEAPRLGRLATTRGKPFANRALQELAIRLRQSGEVLAHSETATLMLAVPANGSLDDEIQRLDRRLAELEHRPLLVDEEQIYLGVRAGIAVREAGDAGSEDWEANAMTALADAQRGHKRVSVYSAHMRGAAVRQVELERDLRRAFENAEFELHYQPKFESDTGRLSGAEALLRWQHPSHGWVAPAEFIPVLEETGLIVPVGHWAMRQALATALEWRVRYQPSFRIAVNVSARELRHRTFLEKRLALLQPWSDDQPIDIEVTESVLMENIDQCVPLLQAFRDLGCKVAIDDFGTGYSSLNYLVRLPVDVIKIDRSFVGKLHESAAMLALTGNIISLSHSLDLVVVAEGVEEEEQAARLRELQCNELQGYLLGWPVSEEAFVERYFGERREEPGEGGSHVNPRM